MAISFGDMFLDNDGDIDAMLSPKETLTDNQKQFAQTAGTKIGQVAGGLRRFYNGVESTVGAPQDSIIRANQNAVSGVVQIPAAVPAMVDLIRIGAPALYTGTVNGDEDKSWLDNVGNAFLDNVYDDEGRATIQKAVSDEVTKFTAQNPNATEQQVKDHLKTFQESDEFYDLSTSQLSFGLRSAAQLNNFANELVGLGVRPDQQTAFDDLMQITGGAIIGIPAATVKSVTDMLGKTALKGVVKSAPARVALKAAELMTPVTLPLNAQNIGANIAVGGAINEALRYAQGEEGLVDYGNLLAQADAPQQPEYLVGGGVTLAALFGGIRHVNRAAVKSAAESAASGVNVRSVFGGETLAEQAARTGDELQPLLNPMTGMIDENAAVTKVANQFTDDANVIHDLDSYVSSASSANIQEAAMNAYNFGTLPNGSKTTSLADYERAFAAMEPDEQTLFNNAVYARDARQSRIMQNTEYTDAYIAARNEKVAADVSMDSGRIQRAAAKLQEAETNMQSIRDDVQGTRPSHEQLSMQDIDYFLNEAQNNPKVKAMTDEWLEISDDIRKMELDTGILSHEEYIKRGQDRAGYLRLEEAAGADIKNKLLRKGVLFARRFSPRDAEKSAQAAVSPKSGRDLSIRASGKVNDPVDAMTAIRRMVANSVRNVQLNNVRREVIDTLRNLPDAKGKAIRRVELNAGNGRTIGQFTEAQAAARSDEILKHNNLVKVYRDGKVEFWQTSDGVTANVLQFGSAHVVPLLDETRKIFQQFVTGLGAPWFAVKNAFWDTFSGGLTKRDGRSFGLMDTYARRLFNESAFANTVSDTYFDPSAFIVTGAAIPYTVAMRATRTLGMKIASDLAHQSGIFSAMARHPAGQQALLNASTKMIERFDKSAYGIMSQRMNVSYGALYDAMQVLDDQRIFAQKASVSSKATAPVKAMFSAYKGLVESVQGAAKTGFFYQNYGTLDLKYKGNIPEKEIARLIQDTRNLSGDMSRKSANKYVQKASTVIPYANAIVQGTRHMVQAAMPAVGAQAINNVGGNMLTTKTNWFWTRLTTGVLLPKLAAFSILSSWEGAEDWWFNRMPDYEQMMNMPLPNIEALQHYLDNGEWPQFHEKYILRIPTPPDVVLFAEPAIAFLREMGLVGTPKSNIPDDMDSTFKRVFDQVTGFATPPLLSMALAAAGQSVDLRAALGGEAGVRDVMSNQSGGANREMMTSDGVVSNTVVNMLAAVMGASAQIVAQTIDAGAIEYNQSQSFTDAFGKALEIGSFEAERRFPQVNPLYDAQVKMNNMTDEGKYVRKTSQILEPIIGSGGQMSIEKDSKRRGALSVALGLNPADKMSDPLLKSMVTVLYDAVKKKGAYKKAGEEYSTARMQIGALENSRTKVPQQQYLEMRNKLVKMQQTYTRIQALELQRIEGVMLKTFGEAFAQQYGTQFSYENLVEAVQADVVRSAK